MLVHVEAHLLKIEKLFTKDRFEVFLKSPEFKVCLFFTVQLFLINVF